MTIAEIQKRRDEEYKMLGLNIAYYRKLRGLTQLQLAEKVDISRTHISNIEAPNIQTSLSLEKLFDIAYVLDVEVADLVTFKK